MKQWVVVVGGTNMDVVARTSEPLVAATSNPGRTRISPGGVGRNSAACLGLLGAPVRLVSAVGTDAFGDEVLRVTARTRTPAVTARLSGFVQPVGYALAALGPFLVGLLHDATDGWDLVLVVLALTSVPFTWAGLRAARPVWVDDEIVAGGV